MHTTIIDFLLNHIFPNLGSIVAAMYAYRAAVISAEAKKAVQEVHVIINSQLERLLKSEKALSFLEGGKDERKQADERQAETDKHEGSI
jgi:hypothetical protein